MNAKEFRIGNIIDMGEILEITDDRVIVRRSELTSLIEGYGTKSISPIPLTPKILKDYGFKELGKEENDIFYKLNLGFYFGKHIAISGYFDGAFISHGTPKIKYLHELQNLCFAITGDELFPK